MADVSVKRNDNNVEFSDTLKIDGAPVDLTNCTVSFLLKKTGLALKKTAVILQTAPPPDPSAGKVKYLSTAQDLSVKGKYREEWEVVFPGGTILTFPNDGYNNVEILEDLG